MSSSNLSESLVSKYVNEKVYFLYGEAHLFIYFLITLILIKHSAIFYLFIFSYGFSIYLRLMKIDFISFLKRLRMGLMGSGKRKSKKGY